MRQSLVIMLLMFGCVAAAAAQTPSPIHLASLAPADTLIRIDRDNLPDAALKTVEAMNVRDADLGDILRGLGVEYGVNVYVAGDLSMPVTARLVDVPVIDVLVFLCRQYRLILEQDESIFTVRRPVRPPPPAAPIHISYQDSLLSVDLDAAPLETVVRRIAELTSENLLLQQNTTGTISGFLQNTPLDAGLTTLFRENGFSLRKRDGVYLVGRDRISFNAESSGTGYVEVAEGLVSLDVTEGPVADILREIAARMELGLVTYELPETAISVRATGMSVDEAFGLLLRGTGVNYRVDGDVYIVGRHDASGIVTSRLIRLSHVRADGVLERLPSQLTRNASVQISREHNGLIVQAPSDALAELEAYIAALDQPMPQVIIEALVVDFDEVELSEIGLSFGRFGAGDSIGARSAIQFGEASSGGRGLSVDLGTRQVQDGLDAIGQALNVPTIGQLPSDFFLRIRALENEGRARVLSRPQIATLSGHPADLSVGTTQYFLLKSSTPVQTGNQYVPVESERFEKIEANISLQVTPWVTSTGEITAEIRPEFSTPVGSFDSSVPPTINTRFLDATVRLKDGETIILGGLIQEASDEDHNKIPILGDIPLLGRAFRSSTTMTRKSVLVIYLTPHIFYGDERDSERWENLRRELELPSPNGDVSPDGSIDGR